MADGRVRASLGDPRFLGYLASQALGAFNDNAFKTFIALLAVATMPPERAAHLIAVAGALFIAPFLLFSTYAGWVADRWSKRSLVLIFKGIELLLALASWAALYTGSIELLLAILFCFGAHSAFFSPVKLAILPELVEEKELSNANGMVQATTFLAIILGTVTAGLLIQSFQTAPWQASWVFLAAAALGLLCGTAIPELPAAGVRSSIRWNLLAESLESLAFLQSMKGVCRATVGSAFFWFLGAIFQMNLLVYGTELMGLSEKECSLFQIVVALGIGLGSFMAGRLSRERVELGLVPLGALGLVFFALDLAFAFRSTAHAAGGLFLLGVSAGCFVVPLQSYIQQNSPKGSRGRLIAIGNLLSFVAVLLASAFLWAFTGPFKLHAGQVFLATAAMTAAVALYLVATLPDFLIRLMLYPIANGIYRIRARGLENVPKEGPALLVSNHISFIDAFLIAMANQRMVRFMMFRAYYDLPIVGWFFKAMRCIPVSDRDGPRALIESFQRAREALQAGEAVCIFAEGEISRHGQMLRFKKGFERIVDGLDVPVVPVHLDQVWGSIFSFEGGRALLKKPRQIPYPVTVSFGKPVPATTSAFALRQSILELGASAFRLRLEERPPLPIAFARVAKRRPWRLAIADSTGAKLSYGGALVRGWLLGREIDRAAPGAEPVGLLLPPSAAAALANIGLGLHGRMAINLNYTASKEIVEACVAKAGIRVVVSSRRFLEKLGWEFPNAVFVEDLAAGIGEVSALFAGLGLLGLPSTIVERTFLERARGLSLEELATVMFTSGSTGIPKGVMITHANVLANVEAVSEIYQLRPSDRILGVLPFFHSFGFTGTLWLPLLNGMSAVYHYSPLDAKKIGELCETLKATMLLGTPTFLQNYLKRVEPARFKSLRLVVVGAEKLREEVALAFEQTFGLTPLEGYGCTELSPVASVNIPDIDWPGHRQKGTKPGTIGHPLPGVFMKIVDSETGVELPAGTAGLLLVKGPNVMRGYLGEPELTKKVLKDGYYVTGDIAAIDQDGFVTITDRLSRFSKIGGEMVPHIRLEQKLHELARMVEQSFVVTAVPDERRGERLIVLVKGEHDLDNIHKMLQASDMPKLWLPDRAAYHKVAEFPVLGSGKLDMQKLKAVARELGAGV